MTVTKEAMPISIARHPVTVPAYDRKAVQTGILHVGVGNFHRAHMASYLDDLFQKHESEEDMKWGIIGAGAHDSRSWKARWERLKEQDFLYTCFERDADVCQPRIMGSIIDALPYDPDLMKQNLMDPNIKIVSMTVTEGGYFLNPSTGQLDTDNSQIQEDIANPSNPTTIFGKIIQALKARKESGVAPFTVLSCDNVPHNGYVTRNVVTELARLMEGDELASWIRETVSFPNGVVDRITPATTDRELDFVKGQFGYECTVPVFCEPFRQWVLEDSFPQGRPALEKVGVKFVPDVTPYEQAKIRILNGGHASLCYPAALLGLDFVHEAVEHSVISKFLDTLERKEIIPGVGPVPDVDLHEYWELIHKRFLNPTLNDRIDRNCKDGADRQPKFIIPPAADSLKDDRDVDGLALVSAMWCKYCQGKTEAGEEIAPNDKIWDRLQETALKANEDPKVWVGMKDIYGDVGQNDKFVQAFDRALKKVTENGVEAAMLEYIENA